MTLETGRLAPQANGAVLVQVGKTTLLSTVVTTKPREGIDFFAAVDVEGADMRGRNPRRYFAVKVAPVSTNLTLPPHRPTAAAVVPEASATGCR